MRPAALYDALFSPASVAIVGASDTPGKTTARPMEYLRRHGWKGDLFPVNPARDTVLGERSWSSLGALPVVPDHVFVLTGADLAIEAVRECADLGVPVATIMADGFIEGDDRGTARRAELQAIVGASGTRLLGPSSLGVAALGDGFALTANAAFAEADLGQGDVFVASQSGSAIGALLSRGKEMGVAFRGMVSTGNELDLTLGEICLGSVDDSRIESYALFLENIKGADDLRAFARAAADRGKPILAYKLGRTEAGARLAVSHSGALAGDDAVADALFRDLGIARVHTFEALLEGQNLARAVPIPVAGTKPRVCVLSTTGGGGAMAVDCLAAAGADLPGPSQETIDRLAEAGIAAGHGALIDLTLAGTRYEVMKGALDVVLAAPEFDAVVAVPGSSARFHPDLAVKPIVDCAAGGKPLAAFVMPAAPEALRLLRSSGVAAFRTAEACADTVLAVFGRRGPAGGERPRLKAPVGGSELLDEARSYEVLGEAGVPCAPHAVVTATSLPSDLPVAGPVAVKVLSSEVPHKTDAGGVVLGVTDGAGLRAAVGRIARTVGERLPGVAADRLLVQTMVRGVGEALVGFRHDPDAGPVVVLAAGGVLAELYRDRSVRSAPVDAATAHEMIDEVVAFRALGGYRGAPAGDLDALACAVVSVSRLAETGGAAILEAEVNPLLVLPEGHGVMAVDALVRRGSED
ncbi:acetate--CoA ligase family protein [Spirillospora sp. CA-128828]|uniref:acetate--CoA ligase family protein n=1 Tax=Spirillospora sp. CA-128828 TaxID=3240033 RepID=UPI003D90BC22